MTTNRYKYFRWTKRTARVTFTYVVFVPALFGILAYSTDVSRRRSCRPTVRKRNMETNANVCSLTGQVEPTGKAERRCFDRVLEREDVRGTDESTIVYMDYRLGNSQYNKIMEEKT
jgi:hypothetical protein